MAVNEVTLLRKEGKLQEAYDLACHELSEERNEWTCMSMFWVLRDTVDKKFLPANNLEEARNCLKQMKDLLPDMIDTSGAGERAYKYLSKLILPNAKEMKDASDLSKTNPNEAYLKATELFGKDAKQLDVNLHEDFGWVVYRYVKAYSEKLTSVQTRCLLRDYMQLQNERPSLLHSTFLNYALNFAKGHPDFSFYRFFILWNPDNLREEDYQEGSKDDHKIPSLISRICRTIVDSGEAFDIPNFVSKFERKDVIIENLRQAYFGKLMSLHKEEKLDGLFQAFAFYADNYSELGPSHWHSEILKIANRFMTDDKSMLFIPFFMKWNSTDNLRNEDWDKETNDEGKEFPSLAEKSAKKCFDIIKSTPKHSVACATLAWLKTLYEEVMNNDSDNDWNVRNYATVCAWCGDMEEAIAMYKSLLVNMGDKYYLWAEMANLLPDRNDVRIGLLLKAKKLEKNEDFLGDIHLSLASLWLEEGYVTIANKELEAYVAQRQEKGWGVSDSYRKLMAIAASRGESSSKADIDAYISIAEDYVYGQYAWKDFVIIEKWKSENVEHCNLFDGKETHLSIKTKRFPILKKAHEGDVIQFRCKVVEEKKYDTTSWKRSLYTVKKTIPLVARKTEKEPWSMLPIKYGVIDYVNENKKTLHIITQDSETVYFKYTGTPSPVDTFVKFREYEKKQKDETYICITNVEPCPSDEALCRMPNRVVVVDDVNERKKLFHVVLGMGKISDIVHFDQTDIRPAIGDFLRITYCVKKNKDGKKRIKFLNIQTSDVGCEGVKGTVAGRLEVKYHSDYFNEEPDFAFVKDIYVHHSILKKYNITDDCDVIAKVVLGGDNKWKVYDLEFPT